MGRAALGMMTAVALSMTTLIACKSQTPCSSDSDCGSKQHCAYDERAGCAATGHCEDFTGADCAGPPRVACGCDGGLVSAASCEIGFSGPVDPGAFRDTTGVCRHPDAGVCTACGPNELCAWSPASGCGAAPTCVRMDLQCISPSVRACGCDGLTFFIDCAYPSGWAQRPITRLGACEDAGPSGGDASYESGMDAADAGG